MKTPKKQIQTVDSLYLTVIHKTKVYFFYLYCKIECMKVIEVIEALEEIAPLSYSEDFDNTGLLLGDTQTEVTGILVTLDTLESVVDEAIQNNCNFIVSFHPIIFNGLKKITGKTYVERVCAESDKA